MEYVGQAEKDPDGVLDFAINWAPWLATGETIATSTWTTPAGITEDSEGETGTVATIWLSGGTDGEDYEAVNKIVTTDVRKPVRTLLIMVRRR